VSTYKISHLLRIFAIKSRKAVQSLRSIVIISIFGLQLITLAAVMILSNRSMEAAVQKQSESLLHQKSAAVIDGVTNFLYLINRIMEPGLILGLATNDQLDTSESTELERYLFNTLQLSPQISGIHFSQPDGSHIYIARTSDTSGQTTSFIFAAEGPPISILRDKNFVPISRLVMADDSYDPRDQSWYLEALRSSTGIWTDAYWFRFRGQYGITFAKPVFKNGVLFGVIGADTEMSAIGKPIMDDLRDSPQATIIRNREGHIILYADQSIAFEDIHPEALRENGYAVIPDSLTASFLRDGLVHSTLVENVSDADSQEYKSITKPLEIPARGWTITIQASSNSLNGGWQSNYIVLSKIILASFLFTSALAFPISNWLTRPILAFSKNTKDASIVTADDDASFKAPYSELTMTGQTLLREVSQRRAFETAYERTFEVSSRGMAHINPSSGRFLRVNSRMCELLGLSKEVVFGRFLWQVLDTTDRRAPANFDEAMMSDREFVIDTKFRRAEGNDLWLRMSAVLIRNFVEDPDYAFVIFDDITAKHVAEEQLNLLKRDLIHVGKINTMGQFAAGLAHELNQPLGAIVHDLNSAQYILRRMAIDKTELTEILNDTVEHAHRAGSIIRAMRELIGKDQRTTEIFDLSDIAHKTHALMEPEAKENGILLQLRFQEGCLVNANRTQIAQVFVNLIRNAIEALVSSGDIGGRVMFGLNVHGQRAHVFIEDNGPGLAADLKPFTNFETTKSDGLGLGLSICKSLVTANGGTIYYQKVEPHGAKFVIELQCHQQEELGNKDA
jgi:PAS domain S-box-containing protein